MTEGLPEGPRPARHLHFIDGLRALAVLAVIVYHLDERLLPGGFTGVDVFFVISGYVVSQSVDGLQPRSLLEFVSAFYARRIRRIVPALLVCLLVSALVSTLLVPRAWLSDTNEQTGIAAFFGVSNVVLAHQSDTYFSPRSEYNPFTHTWSLGVEEQFYLVFPLLFYGWVAAGAGWARQRRSMLGYALVLVASVVAALLLGSSHPQLAFYSILTRFWQLAAGVLLYQLTRRPAWAALRLPPAALAAIGALGLALIVSGLLFANAERFPLPWALAPVVGTLLVLAALRAEPLPSPVNRLLSVPPVAYTGRISYSLYLWHWPVLVMLRWTMGIEQPAQKALALALTAALAVASYHAVEKPFRQQRGSGGPSRRAVIACGLGAVALGGALAAAMFAAQPRLSLSRTHDAAIWYPDGVPAQAAVAPACALAESSAPFEDGSLRHFAPGGCPAAATAPRLFVAGDSHAWAYTSMLRRHAQISGSEIWLYTKGGCGFMRLTFAQFVERPHCHRYLSALAAELQRQARPGDVLFLPSLRLERLANQWGAFEREQVLARSASEQAQTRRRAAAEEAIGVLRPLTERGVQVVFEAPKPLFAVAPFRCSDWFNRMNPSCAAGFEMARDFLLDYRKPILESMARVSGELRHVTIWDPFPVLCPAAPCRAVDERGPIYFDADHLSGLGNLRLYPSFAERMLQLRDAAQGAAYNSRSSARSERVSTSSSTPGSANSTPKDG
ncbi:acyltransferase family protein [Rivibacter subsaxonicus]|uniref:Peptidoglycan/LPS O-acetylase OafA/YrhL n=1 Tax=Rivibacter subsaxonicus TaxID=457575 RepID=A0A4Q7W0E2_9BURK|nr:acyltransferase family protein [Rivibacter subsaxonicus]RZU02560.1 peptidoglycan/LPS O-acetylase OafA/YrhL [Rivibacter subsaxonicus]